MKSIKEKAEEYSSGYMNLDRQQVAKQALEYGANYVLDAIIKCMPKTHSFNPNEVVDIIANKIKELKK